MNTLLLKRPQIALTYSRRQATFNETENAARKRRFAAQINYGWSITNYELSHQHIVHSAFDELRHRKASSNFQIIKSSNHSSPAHQHTSKPAHQHIVRSAFDKNSGIVKHFQIWPLSSSKGKFSNLQIILHQHTSKPAHQHTSTSFTLPSMNSGIVNIFKYGP